MKSVSGTSNLAPRVPISPSSTRPRHWLVGSDMPGRHRRNALPGRAHPAAQALLVELVRSVDQVNAVLFLPLFFVLSGLLTQLGLISAPMLWLVCLLILLVACVGKLTGDSLPVRFIGRSWQEALSLGVLMNTRGLVSLIVLTIGLDLSAYCCQVSGQQSWEICAERLVWTDHETWKRSPLRCDQRNAREETGPLSPPSQLAGREQSAEGALPTLQS